MSRGYFFEGRLTTLSVTFKGQSIIRIGFTLIRVDNLTQIFKASSVILDRRE